MVIMTERPPEPNILQAGQFLFSILRNFEQVFPDDLQKNILIKKGRNRNEFRFVIDRGEIVGVSEQHNKLADVFQELILGGERTVSDHFEQRLLFAQDK